MDTGYIVKLGYACRVRETAAVFWSTVSWLDSFCGKGYNMSLYLYCKRCDDHMTVMSDVRLMTVADEYDMPCYELVHTLHCSSCREQFEEDKALGKTDRCVVPPPSFDYDMELRRFYSNWK